MLKGSRKIKLRKRDAPYFNFMKFERQLDKLRQQGVNVVSVDYPVKDLRKYSNFQYYFENFTEQQIKAQLTFYAKQFEESIE